MEIAKKIVSKKDITIPKGTIFRNIDRSSSKFIYDNYDVIIGLDKNTTVRLIVSNGDKEYFKEVKK